MSRLFLNKEILLILFGFLLSFSLLLCGFGKGVEKNHSFSPEKFKTNSAIAIPVVQVEKKENRFLVSSELKNKILLSVNGNAFEKLEETTFESKDHHLIKIPSSVRWKNPLSNEHHASALKYFSLNDKNEKSAFVYQTLFYEQSDLKKVSLFIEEDDFFDFFRGIYVRGVGELITDSSYQAPWWDQPANYHGRGKKWERKGFFQYYDENNVLLCESEITLAINGNASRAYPIKSLRVKAKKTFKYNFFDNLQDKKYSSLILRNSGNDFDRTYIADAFAHYLCEITAKKNLVDAQTYEPVLVYINGAYWGIHNLRERLDNNRLADKYQAKKKNITILEGLEWKEGSKKTAKSFNDFYQKILKTDFKNQESLALFKQEVNYENYLHYLCVQLFCSNTDWPANNVKCFKIEDAKAPLEKQKWNYIMWDMDYAFSYTGNEAVKTDMFKHILKSNGSFGKMFTKLMENPVFKSDLKNSLELFLEHELMSSEKLEQLVDEFSSRIDSDMKNHIDRWRYPSSYQEWKNNLNGLKEFLAQRSVYLKQHIKEHL